MTKRKNIDNEKWIKNTALLFYQIFSVDYDYEVFLNKILSGGGGNSTLCSTWTKLGGEFIPHRISKTAYKLLKDKLPNEDKSKVRLEKDTVYISKKILKKYHTWFYNNAKGVENRKNAGKFFHFDHHPSNKKILDILHNEIQSHKNDDEYLAKLIEYIKNVQTLDLITVEEDQIRTLTDKRSSNGPLSLKDRDKLLKTKFYFLIEE